jgi:DHA2 family multidrug resistance protein
MLGVILERLDVSIVNVSLPHMQGSFSASIDEIAWVVTSYLVANGIMIPLTGWLASRIGNKRYFLISVVTFVTASALCGAASSLAQMVFFRLLQGIGGAAMLPLSQTLLRQTFPAEERVLAMSIWGIGVAVAPILGPTLGGWITDNWNWRWNFYINVPIGFLAFLMVSTFVHDSSNVSSPSVRGRVDYRSIILLCLWLGLLQLVLDRGQRADWFESRWVVSATAISAAAMMLLVARELKLKDPILDLRLLKIRQFAAGVFVWFVLFLILSGNGVLNPVFLQEFMGYPAWRAGIVFAGRGAGAMVTMLFVSRIARAGFGNQRLIGLSFFISAVGLWLMAGWNLETPMARVILDGTLIGIGLGLCFPILSTLVLALECFPNR